MEKTAVYVNNGNNEHNVDIALLKTYQEALELKPGDYKVIKHNKDFIVCIAAQTNDDRKEKVILQFKTTRYINKSVINCVLENYTIPWTAGSYYMYMYI